jgi:PhzF family phenazine biosynthesis protein
MMTDAPEILRYAAFTDRPGGGNPAGVVLDAAGLDDEEMQRIAAEVDFSETAFVTGAEAGARVVRYFSPIAEVPFCGHATIATAVALAEREGPGTVRFQTPVGEIAIETSAVPGSPHDIRAAFTSVDTDLAPIPEFVLEGLLVLLGLDRTELHERYAPRLAFAGNWHPVLVLARRESFDGFQFDAGAARAFMDAQGWKATITVLHPIGERDAAPTRFEARNLFPVGRISEDPATGSAAAAVGGYLRALGLITPPARVVIEQGRHVGRPGRLTVDIPAAGGITVSGSAVAIG